MTWFRKVLVAFFAFILLLSLLDLAYSTSLNRNFGTSDNIKTWLAESKIYDKALNAVLDATQEQSNKNGGDQSISLTDSVVKQAATEAFSPQLLQNSVNSFIDANYAWLSGKTATPEFKIDLSNAKDDFATKIGNAVQTRLTGLTACTPAQETQLQLPVDVMTVTCRPPNLDPKTEGARVANEIRISEFLSKPVITADSLAHDQSNTSSKPYYVQLSKAPAIFQFQQKAPYVLAGVVLLTSLAIVTIAPERRMGWRRIGSVSLTAGTLLVVSKFIGDIGVNRLEDQISTSKTVISQLRQPGVELLKHIQSQVVQINFYFGIAFIVIALIIYAVLFKTKEKNTKLETPKAPTIDDDEPTPAPAPRPAATNTGAGQKPTGPPVFKTPTPAGQLPKKRPPRLIQ
jgi:hypothetical protein